MLVIFLLCMFKKCGQHVPLQGTTHCPHLSGPCSELTVCCNYQHASIGTFRVPVQVPAKRYLEGVRLLGRACWCVCVGGEAAQGSLAAEQGT
jgi:hypothetical protein